MELNFICDSCGKTYPISSLIWKCPADGGLLNLENYGAQGTANFSLNQLRDRQASLWRYREALPFDLDYQGWRFVTMGEGFTPFVPVNMQNPNILLKVEYASPTLSFKDRGAAVLIAKAQELGVTRLVEDSSGNAGTAVAAYARRAGIECDIFVPESASAKKIKQIAAHGAHVHQVPGSREDTAAAAIESVEKGGAFYASHIYNPLFFEGTKTYAFEIWEQLGGAVPDVVVLPVGHGTLVLGTYYGFKELQNAGLIDHLPRFLCIQAENCAPLAEAFDAGKTEAEFVQNLGTEAEGIAIANPPRSRQILAAVRDTGGVITTVPEAAIEWGKEYLAKQGFYVEPTAAATYAGFSVYIARYLTNGSDAASVFRGNPLEAGSREIVVIPLCGAGLKAN